MSDQIELKDSTENQDNDSIDTDDISKGSTNSGDGNNVATSRSKLSNSTKTKKRINEASLSADEIERLQAKRAYNRECASRARRRGKELIAQLERQVKDLHDDKSELRRTVATMEKRLKHLKRENELLINKQGLITNYDGVTAGEMIENGAILPPTQFHFVPGFRSRNFNSATMTMNGAPFMGHNPFY